MDLAFLYSVYWNLFNESLVWTGSHAPLERGPGTQSSNKLVGGWAQDAVWSTRQVSRRRRVEAKQDLDHNPLSSSRPLFSSFLILPPPSSFLFSHSSLPFPFLTGFPPPLSCLCRTPFTFFLFDLWMN